MDVHSPKNMPASGLLLDIKKLNVTPKSELRLSVESELSIPPFQQKIELDEAGETTETERLAHPTDLFAADFDELFNRDVEHIKASHNISITDLCDSINRLDLDCSQEICESSSKQTSPYVSGELRNEINNLGNMLVYEARNANKDTSIFISPEEEYELLNGSDAADMNLEDFQNISHFDELLDHDLEILRQHSPEPVSKYIDMSEITEYFEDKYNPIHRIASETSSQDNRQLDEILDLEQNIKIYNFVPVDTVSSTFSTVESGIYEGLGENIISLTEICLPDVDNSFNLANPTSEERESDLLNAIENPFMLEEMSINQANDHAVGIIPDLSDSIHRFYEDVSDTELSAYLKDSTVDVCAKNSDYEDVSETNLSDYLNQHNSLHTIETVFQDHAAQMTENTPIMANDDNKIVNETKIGDAYKDEDVNKDRIKNNTCHKAEVNFDVTEYEPQNESVIKRVTNQDIKRNDENLVIEFDIVKDELESKTPVQTMPEPKDLPEPTEVDNAKIKNNDDVVEIEVEVTSDLGEDKICAEVENEVEIKVNTVILEDIVINKQLHHHIVEIKDIIKATTENPMVFSSEIENNLDALVDAKVENTIMNEAEIEYPLAVSSANEADNGVEVKTEVISDETVNEIKTSIGVLESTKECDVEMLTTIEVSSIDDISDMSKAYDQDKIVFKDTIGVDNNKGIEMKNEEEIKTQQENYGKNDHMFLTMTHNTEKKDDLHHLTETVLEASSIRLDEAETSITSLLQNENCVSTGMEYNTNLNPKETEIEHINENILENEVDSITKIEDTIGVDNNKGIEMKNEEEIKTQQENYGKNDHMFLTMTHNTEKKDDLHHLTETVLEASSIRLDEAETSITSLLQNENCVSTGMEYNTNLNPKETEIEHINENILENEMDSITEIEVNDTECKLENQSDIGVIEDFNAKFENILDYQVENGFKVGNTNGDLKGTETETPGEFQMNETEIGAKTKIGAANQLKIEFRNQQDNDHVVEIGVEVTSDLGEDKICAEVENEVEIKVNTVILEDIVINKQLHHHFTNREFESHSPIETFKQDKFEASNIVEIKDIIEATTENPMVLSSEIEDNLDALVDATVENAIMNEAEIEYPLAVSSANEADNGVDVKTEFISDETVNKIKTSIGVLESTRECDVEMITTIEVVSTDDISDMSKAYDQDKIVFKDTIGVDNNIGIETKDDLHNLTETVLEASGIRFNEAQPSITSLLQNENCVSTGMENNTNLNAKETKIEHINENILENEHEVDSITEIEAYDTECKPENKSDIGVIEDFNAEFENILDYQVEGGFEVGHTIGDLKGTETETPGKFQMNETEIGAKMKIRAANDLKIEFRNQQDYIETDINMGIGNFEIISKDDGGIKTQVEDSCYMKAETGNSKNNTTEDELGIEVKNKANMRHNIVDANVNERMFEFDVREVSKVLVDNKGNTETDIIVHGTDSEPESQFHMEMTNQAEIEIDGKSLFEDKVKDSLQCKFENKDADNKSFDIKADSVSSAEYTEFLEKVKVETKVEYFVIETEIKSPTEFNTIIEDDIDAGMENDHQNSVKAPETVNETNSYDIVEDNIIIENTVIFNTSFDAEVAVTEVQFDVGIEVTTQDAMIIDNETKMNNKIEIQTHVDDSYHNEVMAKSTVMLNKKWETEETKMHDSNTETAVESTSIDENEICNEAEDNTKVKHDMGDKIVNEIKVEHLMEDRAISENIVNTRVENKFVDSKHKNQYDIVSTAQEADDKSGTRNYIRLQSNAVHDIETHEDNSCIKTEIKSSLLLHTCFDDDLNDQFENEETEMNNTKIETPVESTTICEDGFFNEAEDGAKDKHDIGNEIVNGIEIENLMEDRALFENIVNSRVENEFTVSKLENRCDNATTAQETDSNSRIDDIGCEPEELFEINTQAENSYNIKPEIDLSVIHNAAFSKNLLCEFEGEPESDIKGRKMAEIEDAGCLSDEDNNFLPVTEVSKLIKSEKPRESMGLLSPSVLRNIDNDDLFINNCVSPSVLFGEKDKQYFENKFPAPSPVSFASFFDYINPVKLKALMLAGGGSTSSLFIGGGGGGVGSVTVRFGLNSKKQKRTRTKIGQKQAKRT